METKTRMSRGKRRAKASRAEILTAARNLGVRNGWKSVTIRSVASALGYAHPLLYEHFRDKGDVLTELAIAGLEDLEGILFEDLPSDPRNVIAAMAERYWRFMLENTQVYRLMNGMDGTAIDRAATREGAQRLCIRIGEVIRGSVGADTQNADIMALTEETWALLHGMATLYLDRSVPFDQVRVRQAALRLVTRSGGQNV